MDKRFKKKRSPAQDSEERDQFRRDILGYKLSIQDAVKAMRRRSRLTQPEFARHRGVSLATLRQIEAGTGNPSVETLNKICSIFGLQVGFIPELEKASGNSEVMIKYSMGLIPKKQAMEALGVSDYGIFVRMMGRAGLPLPAVSKDLEQKMVGDFLQVVSQSAGRSGRKKNRYRLQFRSCPPSPSPTATSAITTAVLPTATARPGFSRNPGGRAATPS